MLSSSIDLSSLPADLARNVVALINEYENKNRDRLEWQAVLDNGTEEEIMIKTMVECGKRTPLVPARCYGEEYIHPMREVTPYGLRGHPRRMVVARGAQLVVYNKYSLSPNNVAPNGWRLRVYDRAIRISKKTLIYRDEILEFIGKVASGVGAPWDYAVRGFEHTTNDNMVLMSGRWVSLTDAEYKSVKMFYDIIRKTDKIEERLALVRKARKEQT